MPEIELLPGNDAFPEQLYHRFALDDQVRPLDTVGGAVSIVGFDRGDHWVVATSGLSRIPLEEGSATEFWMEISPDQVGAAAIGLQVAVQEIVEGDRRMWGPDHVWINSGVLLEGTRIQALAVSPFVDGVADVTDAAGQQVGQLRELLLLTKPEARGLALDGPATLVAARESDRAAFRDVERDHLFRSDSIPDVPCMVSVMAREHPVQWLEMDEQGRFLAFTQRESQEYWDDPDNLELWSLQTLAELNPGPVTEFLLEADPGEFLTFSDGDWHQGHLSELDEVE